MRINAYNLLCASAYEKPVSQSRQAGLAKDYKMLARNGMHLNFAGKLSGQASYNPSGRKPRGLTRRFGGALLLWGIDSELVAQTL